MGFITEFKSFALRGNVMDMAVGIVIGAAFATIVNSFVNDILMPPIGMAIGNVDFTELKVILKDPVVATDGTVTDAVSINYGNFIQVLINFLLIALAIFSVITWMNSLRKKEEKAPTEEPKLSREVQLLQEIRDSLRK
ncbi:MAG: large-conductance mechanosensitive channel protein MscL [Bacteroidia bacterium]